MKPFVREAAPLEEPVLKDIVPSLTPAQIRLLKAMNTPDGEVMWSMGCGTRIINRSLKKIHPLTVRTLQRYGLVDHTVYSSSSHAGWNINDNGKRILKYVG